MRETMQLADFQMTIRAFPVAQSLYLKYCRENTPETLRDIYSQEDDYLSQAACFIKDFYDPKASSGGEGKGEGGHLEKIIKYLKKNFFCQLEFVERRISHFGNRLLRESEK